MMERPAKGIRIMLDMFRHGYLIINDTNDLAVLKETLDHYEEPETTELLAAFERAVNDIPKAIITTVFIDANCPWLCNLLASDTMTSFDRLGPALTALSESILLIPNIP